MCLVLSSLVCRLLMLQCEACVSQHCPDGTAVRSLGELISELLVRRNPKERQLATLIVGNEFVANLLF